MTRRELPTGTITFLFSDIEGSTRLVADVGPAIFRDVLETHNRLLREAFASHGGTERGTQGDSFLVMFRGAGEAAAAAVDAQRALAEQQWPSPVSVAVRMGIHTGLGILGGDDYVGVDVNRAARIAAAAHGGQILMSQSTWALLAHSLPGGAELRDLGEHTLRDLPGTERLYQLVVDGLRSGFPPIRGAAALRPDLPDRTSVFVGREYELSDLQRLIMTRRLVTLTGPGGTGKSSLAVEVARRLAGEIPVSVHWVPLSSVSDPTFVAGVIAERLGVVPSAERSPLDGVCEVIGERKMLLILDNLEHLLDSAAAIDELLRRAPNLRILATSRAPLHLTLEQEYPVAPLPVPMAGDAPTTILDNPAVRLFLERARRVQPGFAPDGAELDAVAEICRRLDGLPLGVEIAASRVGLLPPRIISQRLAQRLDLPGQGPRDVPERQRTLTGTIAWSYDLLDTDLRRMLESLSMFAGGGRFEEVETVCATGDGGDQTDVLEGLSSLVDQNLVLARSDPDGLRIRMLETIRMYARERLAAHPADETLARHRHAHAYLSLVETAAGHLPGRGQVTWLDRLTLEHDNLRAATDRAIEAAEVSLAMRLGAASWRFWQLRGHLDEGRAVMARILAMPGADVASIERVGALRAAGSLAWWAADVAADALYGAALDTARVVGDRSTIADAAFDYAHTQHVLGNTDAVQRLRAEARETFVDTGNEVAVARLDWTDGWLLLATGRAIEARDLMLGLLPTFEALDDEFYVAMTTMALGGISLQLGAPEEGFRWGLRCMLAQYSMGDSASFALGLRGMALGCLSLGHLPEAAMINGTFESMCREYGIRPPSDPAAWIPVFTADKAGVSQLTDPAWASEIARGSRMTIDEVMEELLRLAREWAITPQVGHPVGGLSSPGGVEL